MQPMRGGGKVPVRGDAGGTAAHRIAGARADHNGKGERAGGEKDQSAQRCRRAVAEGAHCIHRSDLEVDHFEHRQIADQHPAGAADQEKLGQMLVPDRGVEIRRRYLHHDE